PVQLSPHNTVFELHFIASQSPSFIAENVFHHPQFFIYTASVHAHFVLIFLHILVLTHKK
ncbi:MAG: hypothetical protein ACK56F_31245, partial [bacterium]